MRKYYKIVAICLIAMLSLGMLSACSGTSLTNRDKTFTGQMHGISKSVEDTTETKVVKTEEIEREVSGDAPVVDTPAEDEPADEGDENEGDTPSENEGESENNEADTPVDDGGVMDADWTTSCMTFNVLQIRNEGTSYADPETRAPWILDTIVRYDPDLLGLQEVTHDNGSNLTWDMHDYLIDNLTAKGYDVSGMMDSKDKPGSKVAVSNYTIGSGLLIMWKKDRFELKDSGAMVFSNDAGRHYQWVKLYDKQEDITILMTNTHMSINPKSGNSEADSKAGGATRAQQAAELYQFWYKNCQGDMALYATGDYNHGTDSQAFANMTKGQYVSTREISQKSNANSGIDHVLINGEIQDCFEYHRCDETYEGGVAKVTENRKQEFSPSDHNAVIAYCSNAYRS